MPANLLGTAMNTVISETGLCGKYNLRFFSSPVGQTCRQDYLTKNVSTTLQDG
jgi:hypothetical protein